VSEQEVVCDRLSTHNKNGFLGKHTCALYCRPRPPSMTEEGGPAAEKTFCRNLLYTEGGLGCWHQQLSLFWFAISLLVESGDAMKAGEIKICVFISEMNARSALFIDLLLDYRRRQ